ncbi:MAG TPA: hypothetical protein VGO62_18875, partial [Myxococcota bacterium]
MRLLVLLVLGALALSCTVTPPITGASCASDRDCAGSPVNHCELALPSPVCLPGRASVVGRANRAPVGVNTLVVGVADTHFRGQIGIVDPDGDSFTIDDPELDFGAGAGIATMTFDADNSGTFSLISSGPAFEDHQTLRVIDQNQNEALIEVLLVLVDANVKTWTPAGDDDFNGAGNWAPT